MNLTERQRAALLRYSERHGRTWKSKLREEWLASSYTLDGDAHDDAPILQCLRNSQDFGPAGLVRVRPVDLSLAIATDGEDADPLPFASERKKEQLVEFVNDLQATLYIGQDGEVDAEREWGSDELASIAELMNRYGFAPREAASTGVND